MSDSWITYNIRHRLLFLASIRMTCFSFKPHDIYMTCFAFKPHDIYIYEKHVIPILLTLTNVISLCSSLHFIVDIINMCYLKENPYKWSCNDVTDVDVSNKMGGRHHITGTIDYYASQIHDHSLSWFATDTTVKGVWVKLVLLGQTSPFTEMGRVEGGVMQGSDEHIWTHYITK